MQLRSLALPFTLIEWTLPTVPRPVQATQPRQLAVVSEESATVAQGGTSSPRATSTDSSEKSTLFDLWQNFIVASYVLKNNSCIISTSKCRSTRRVSRWLFRKFRICFSEWCPWSFWGPWSEDPRLQVPYLWDWWASVFLKFILHIV